MKSVKRDGEWWITEIPEAEDCGPYETKPEAEDDLEGLERTERWGHLHKYWTTETKKTKKPAVKIEKPVEKPVKTTKKKTAKKKTTKRKKKVV